MPSRREITTYSARALGGLSSLCEGGALKRYFSDRKSVPTFRLTNRFDLHPSKSMGTKYRMRVCAVLAVMLIAGVRVNSAPAENLTLRIPPVKIPFTVKDQAVTITASALISMVSRAGDLEVFKLDLSADLADLQRNMTGLLSSQLDKDDHCGDRIAIQNATLMPAEPASVATVQLHYERWACIKAFGKQQAKRVVGGNAVIPVKLTPGLEENNAELRLVPEVGTIEADGSLGELLRSGAVGEMIRDKIRSAILSAMKKGTNLSATLPPAAQGYVTIENAAFRDGGSGRLMVVLDGELRITKEQVQMLSKQVKERVAGR
jgi:hypothetical protein